MAKHEPEILTHTDKHPGCHIVGNERRDLTCDTVLGRLLHEALVVRFTEAAGPSIVVDTTS